MATGFTAPVHWCVDDQGRRDVTATGHTIDVAPCILSMDMTPGACWHQGAHYVTTTDSLVRVPCGHVVH